MPMMTAARFICLCGFMFSATNSASSQTTGQQADAWQFAQTRNRVLTPAMQYFGGDRVSPSLPQQRRNLAAAPRSVRISRSKPFQDAVQPKTLSPYLHLNRFETDTSLPNYHLYVRPQLEQQHENGQLARKVDRLQRQQRSAAAAGIGSPNPRGGTPPTDDNSQFMNVGSYYPGLRK
jgi:hypothetical protein